MLYNIPKLYRLVIGPLYLALIVQHVQTALYWSVEYCAPEGCLRRCSHIKQEDMHPWCNGIVKHRAHGGDVDNNGMCDAICVAIDGRVYVNYHKSNALSFENESGGTRKKSTTFCLPSTYSHTYVRDINMDGYDDVICVIDDVPNDNQVTVSYIAGRKDHLLPDTDETVTKAVISTASFINSTNATFSDPNQFKRSAICTKYQSQCSHVHQESIAPVAQWYPWCFPGTGSFFSGDLNGDGYCDIICHHYTSNHIQVMFYIADTRTFVAPLESFRADGSLIQLGSWCESTDSIVRVIDINFDGRADIVCGLSGLFAADSYNIRVIYGAPYNEFISTSSAHPSEVRSSDVFKDASSDPDPTVSCAASVKHVSGPNGANPCENITLNAAYFQGDAESVLDTRLGSFCRNSSTSLFISADVDGNGYCDMICQDNAVSPETSVYVQYLTNDGVTYETRHNLPAETAGLGPNFTCPKIGQLFTFDFNGDSHWDLLCTHTNMSLTCGMQLKITYWLANGDSTGFSPDTVPLSRMMESDLLLGSKNCRPECQPFTVTNGFVTYDTIRLRFEVTCKAGFQLRGRRFIGCASGPHYMAAFPLCREIRPDKNFNMQKGSGLTSVFPPAEFLYSAFDALKVVFSNSIEACVWTCNDNAECISATMYDNTCKLYAYQAKVEKPGTGNMLIILPALKSV